MNKYLISDDWDFSVEHELKEKVTLPHDAMLVSGRDCEAASGQGGGYFLGGKYIYRKKFMPEPSWKEKDIFIEFEGVYPNARVFLNGKEMGGCCYGYNQFRVKLEGINYEMENQLFVEVDNTKLPNSRWYSGAGIYRPAWLIEASKKRIALDGIRVETLSIHPAKIKVTIALEGVEENSAIQVKVDIFYQDKLVFKSEGKEAEIEIRNAALWSEESPDLYKASVTLIEDGKEIDNQQISFGIRTITWNNGGLFINGKETKLKGGCIHHDNGILGAMEFKEAEYRKIKRLKEFGFNAIRSAHNPASRELLEVCDELGMYVMDETWDMWDKHKNEFDYAADFKDHFKEDIRAIVNKDFNHPSVIMYSIGNEVTEPAKEEGVKLASEIVSGLKELDNTRPVTCGINLTLLLMASMDQTVGQGDAAGPAGIPQEMNSTAYNKMVSEMGNRMLLAAASEAADKVASPVLDLLDISGYNYASTRYDMDGKLHPDRIIVGSETYTYEIARNWKMVEKYPYIIGDFMWTAWDYLGEAGVGGWSYDEQNAGFSKTYPWLLADTGAFDILGNDGAAAGLAAVVFGARKTPYIAVCPVNKEGKEPIKAIWRGSNAMPYWSYDGCEGQKATIEVYSDGASVELFVNDKSCGIKELTDYMASFEAIYEPGVIKAVALDEKGDMISESFLASATGDTKIAITPETEDIKTGDITYFDISLRGENGQVECNKDCEIKLQVTGGELLGFGSANPCTEEDFLSGIHNTYYGRAQAVVRVTSPELILAASADNMEEAAWIGGVSGNEF